MGSASGAVAFRTNDKAGELGKRFEVLVSPKGGFEDEAHVFKKNVRIRSPRLPDCVLCRFVI
jgi:hypothetical protein